MIDSVKSQQHIPISIQFPSFAPSPQISPKNEKSGESSTFQSLNSPQVHKISIHLPEQLFEDNQESGDCRETILAPLKQTNNKQQLLDDTGNIRVFCRMRKPTKSEDSIKYDSTMIDDGENCYSFDYIFHKNAVQKELYEKIARRHIDDFFMFKNSTIFAYGQTGSGKTYTMFGKLNQPTQYGIIPRTLEQIFRRNKPENCITCSMLEIYNQKLNDLFGRIANSQTQIKLKEVNQQIYLEGLQQIAVENKEQVLRLIQQGHKNRKISSTLSNDSSSRSHTILFVTRKAKCLNQYITSKLCFIDLAGSEKVKKSGAKGQTLEQTKKINLSLSCLGNVVHSLTNGSQHIPYRNSKLTRILKDSLASDTATSIITTCSLQKLDYNQTLSTIKFAVRAKKIKNKKKLENEEVSLEEKFKILKKELQETKKQLAHYKQQEKMSKIFTSLDKVDQQSFLKETLSLKPVQELNSWKKDINPLQKENFYLATQDIKQTQTQQIAEQEAEIEMHPSKIYMPSKGTTSRIKTQAIFHTNQ